MPKSEDELRAEAERLIAENAPSDMEGALIAMHSMYEELRKSGFKQWEALWIVAYQLNNGSGRDLE